MLAACIVGSMARREHYRIVCFFDGNFDNKLRALSGPEI